MRARVNRCFSVGADFVRDGPASRRMPIADGVRSYKIKSPSASERPEDSCRYRAFGLIEHNPASRISNAPVTVHTVGASPKTMTPISVAKASSE